MPIYQLDDEIWFPHPSLAHEEGILAVGGDLSPKRLLTAYYNGIFPWFSEGEPIVWWSPDPRMVLWPDDLKVSKSMRKVIRDEVFTMSIDTAFEEVIVACADQPRRDQDGTWITDDMQQAYIKLHELGFAHSVEVWQNEELVGGLYGIMVGSIFCGESMFARVSNASKFGFIKLVQALKKAGCTMIDCQTYTDHLASLGADEIPREEFLEHLEQHNQQSILPGKWTWLDDDLHSK